MTEPKKLDDVVQINITVEPSLLEPPCQFLVDEMTPENLATQVREHILRSAIIRVTKGGLLLFVLLFGCEETATEEIRQCNGSVVELLNDDQWTFERDCAEYVCQGQSKP